MDVEDLIKKKKEIGGRRIKDIENVLAPRMPFAEVAAFEKGGLLTVVIKPKKGYEYKFDVTEPFVYETEAPRSRGDIKTIIDIVLYEWYMNYPKPPVIFNFENLAAKVLDRVRAIEIFMYLCQEGSPFHCSFLSAYLDKLIDEALKTEDKVERKYMTQYLRGARLNRLADILTELDVTEISEREKEIIREAASSAIREILSSYAPVYRPDHFPESAREKTWEIANEACKKDSYEWLPADVDESGIILALRKVSSHIPLLREALGVEEETEEREEKEETEKEEKEEKEIEEEEIKEIKKRILEKIRKLG